MPVDNRSPPAVLSGSADRSDHQKLLSCLPLGQIKQAILADLKCTVAPHTLDRDENAVETEASITMKLKRGTFSATFFLACLAALELDGVALEEI